MSQVRNPRLWKYIKEKWHRGSKGGIAGQWNARKAQLAVQEYKRKGGTYKTSRKSNTNSLVRWTKEDWGYIDNKKGNRYLPRLVRNKLTPREKANENRRKRRATRHRTQRASYSATVLKKFNKYTGRLTKNRTT
jgi:hypothetical protein